MSGDDEGQSGKLEATVNGLQKVNENTTEMVSNAVGDARDSVHDIHYRLDRTADGLELEARGKLDDVKNFEKELKKQFNDYDVSINVDIDYDIDAHVDMNFSRSTDE